MPLLVDGRAAPALETSGGSPAGGPDRDELDHPDAAPDIVAAVPMARRLARAYAGRGIPHEDLAQVACLALVVAARRFDPSRGDPFEVFARATIRGELRKHFRDRGWMIRPPRGLQELQSRVWAVEDELTARLGRSPEPAEIAATLGEDVRSVQEALGLRNCFATRSLEEPTAAGAADARERLCGELEAGFEQVECAIVVRGALAALPERDRHIVHMKFFEGLTQAQIGERIGVTQMQVSRLLSRILRDLRRSLSEDRQAA